MALTTGMGLIQWKKFAVERLPIPRLPIPQQRPFIEIVDQILTTGDTRSDTGLGELEQGIDRLVYEMYGLSQDEISAVEERL